MVMSLRSASTEMRPTHFTWRARHACPSAQACTSACRSVSSTCSTSEPGRTRCLPTSKIRTERTYPLPFAAEEPTSTFWQRAIRPTLEKQAASRASHLLVESPNSTASLSSGESFATSKNVFWMASRYCLSAAPADDSFTRGKMQSEVSSSSLRSRAGRSGPAIGSGRTSSALAWAAGGGVEAAGAAAAGAAGFTTVGSVLGSGIDESPFCFFDWAAAANEIIKSSENRARMCPPLEEVRDCHRSNLAGESRRGAVLSSCSADGTGSELVAPPPRFQSVHHRSDVLCAAARDHQQRVSRIHHAEPAQAHHRHQPLPFREHDAVLAVDCDGVSAHRVPARVQRAYLWEGGERSDVAPAEVPGHEGYAVRGQRLRLHHPVVDADGLERREVPAARQPLMDLRQVPLERLQHRID